MAENYSRRHKGSMTIEAVLIVSSLLMILALLIYSFLIMYQKVLLTEISQLVAQQGSVMWTDNRKDIDGIYYRIMDDALFTGFKISEKVDLYSLPNQTSVKEKGSLADVKINKIKNHLYQQLSKGILKPKDTYIDIHYSNTVIQRQINIKITQEINIPLGGLKEFFGGKKTLTIVGEGTAVITEPTQYIRNVDLLIEYTSKAGDALNIQQKVESLRQRLKVGKQNGGIQ